MSKVSQVGTGRTSSVRPATNGAKTIKNGGKTRYVAEKGGRVKSKYENLPVPHNWLTMSDADKRIWMRDYLRTLDIDSVAQIISSPKKRRYCELKADPRYDKCTDGDLWVMAGYKDTKDMRYAMTDMCVLTYIDMLRQNNQIMYMDSKKIASKEEILQFFSELGLSGKLLNKSTYIDEIVDDPSLRIRAVEQLAKAFGLTNNYNLTAQAKIEILLPDNHNVSQNETSKVQDIYDNEDSNNIA